MIFTRGDGVTFIEMWKGGEQVFYHMYHYGLELIMYYFSKRASHFFIGNIKQYPLEMEKIMISLKKIFSKCGKRWEEETEPVPPLQQEEKGAVLSHFIFNKHMYRGISQHSTALTVVFYFYDQVNRERVG